MEIDLRVVRQKFTDVLDGRLSREDADRWAYGVLQQEEKGAVTYSPPADKSRIWAGIMYLYGIDAKDSPDEYLHTDEDIQVAMKAKLD